MADESTIPNTVPEGLPDVGRDVPTDEAAAAKAKVIAGVPTEVDNLAVQMREALRQGFTRGYQAAWKFALGLTPKEFFAALGPKGAAFLIRGGATRAFYNAQYPNDPLPGIPEQYDYKVGGDGSVTVTEK